MFTIIQSDFHRFLFTGWIPFTKVVDTGWSTCQVTGWTVETSPNSFLSSSESELKSNFLVTLRFLYKESLETSYSLIDDLSKVFEVFDSFRKFSEKIETLIHASCNIVLGTNWNHNFWSRIDILHRPVWGSCVMQKSSRSTGQLLLSANRRFPLPANLHCKAIIF